MTPHVILSQKCILWERGLVKLPQPWGVSFIWLTAHRQTKNTLLKTSKWALFLFPSDVCVRSFLHLCYILIKLCCTKISKYSSLVTDPGLKFSPPEVTDPSVTHGSQLQSFKSKTQIPPQPVPPFRKLPQASYPYPSKGRQNESHNDRILTKLITWITVLSNSMKPWAMLGRATQDRWVMVESSDKTWSIGEGNSKPLQYSCLENPMNCMNSMKRYDTERWTPQMSRCPICYWRIAEK